MKIKLTCIMAGPDGTAHPGDVVEVSDAQGKALIAGKYGIEAKAAKAKPAEEKDKNNGEKTNEGGEKTKEKSKA